jgi:phosphate starvation-inducible PhoH-like protein
MKMFLTRLGEGSAMAITGDPSQIDLGPGMTPGLVHAVDMLEGIPKSRVVRFTDRDVVRHSLVSHIVQAYDADDRKRAAARADEKKP